MYVFTLFFLKIQNSIALSYNLWSTNYFLFLSIITLLNEGSLIFDALIFFIKINFSRKICIRPLIATVLAQHTNNSSVGHNLRKRIHRSYVSDNILTEFSEIPGNAVDRSSRISTRKFPGEISVVSFVGGGCQSFFVIFN